MKDDPISVSDKELKEIIAKDSGFRTFINSLPRAAAEGIKSLASNAGILKMLVKLLPKKQQDQVNQLFHVIFQVPQEAAQLYREGRFFDARLKLQQALEVFQYSPEESLGSLGQATTFAVKRARSLLFGLLADVENTLGNIEETERCNMLALELAEETGDKQTIAKALLGLGFYHSERGEFEEALRLCTQALQVIGGVDDQWRLHQKILNTLSFLHRELGDMDEAADFARQVIELCNTTNDQDMLPVCLNNYALVLADAGEKREATESLEVAFTMAKEQGDKRIQSLLLCNMTMFHLMLGIDESDFGPVLSCLDEAMKIARETGSLSHQALAHHVFGRVFHAVGDQHKARRSYDEAASIYRQTGARADEAAVLAHIGELLRDEVMDFEGACDHFRQSIAIIERIRGRMKREIHRISYAQSMTDPYASIVDCLVRLNRLEEALEYVERSKSRAMLDFLEARLRDPGILHLDDESFARAMNVLTEMNEIRRGLEELARRGELPDDGSYERSQGRGHVYITEPLIDDLMKKEKEFTTAYADLISLDSEKASLMAVMPVSYEGLVVGIDEDTAILNLFQTDSDLLMLLASHSGPIMFRSAGIPREEAAELVWHLASSLRRGTACDPKSHEYIREIQVPLADLYERLVGPFEGALLRYQRIMVSPHLFWHYLPFHALYNRHMKVHLCDMMEVGYCPSASILRLCLLKQRTNRDSALVISKNRGDLPFAGRESRLISEVFQPGRSLLVENRANLSMLDERAYDLIHLACHGTFDQEHPFLSGIDIPPDNERDRQTFLMDFFHLHLNCSQVTISACDSGLTHMTSADEMVGLSRGLFYAGATSLMLSLWRVADESTCHLMQNYYRHYVRDGYTKTRSLQLAMHAVKSVPEWSHPHFWAPFVVMGDWR